MSPPKSADRAPPPAHPTTPRPTEAAPALGATETLGAFEMALETRGYEADASRTVPAPVLLGYLEHQRWQLIARPEVGLVDHIHAGHFFVVYAQTLAIVRRVGVSVPLVVRGVMEQVGRSSATVRHEVVRQADGALVAWARVRGAWLGPDRGLARIPARLRAVCEAQAGALRGLVDPLAAPAPDLAAEPVGSATSYFAPLPQVHRPLDLEVAPPETPPQDAQGAPLAPDYTDQVVLRPSDCDIFGHVNASNYLRLCDDARHRGAAAHAFGGASPRAARAAVRVSLKYQREARAGDAVAVQVWRLPEPGALGFALLREGEAAPLCLARIDTDEPG